MMKLNQLINGIAWRFPAIVHELVLSLTGYRQVRMTNAITGKHIGYYWTAQYHGKQNRAVDIDTKTER